MVKKAQHWIDAVEKLAGDNSARVTCPACGQASLITSDERSMKYGRFQRNFECPACEERGSVLLGGGDGFTENGATLSKDADADTTAGKLRRFLVNALKALARKN